MESNLHHNQSSETMITREANRSCLPAFVCSLVLLATGDTSSQEIEQWPFASEWQGGLAAKSEPHASRQEGPAASQWLVLDTGGSGGMFGQGDIRHNLVDVSFWTDGQHGAACGDAGAFYTSDGGISWKRIRLHPRKQYAPETGVRYYAVEMGGPTEIWIAEGKHPAQGRHLWHSTNAGQDWEDAADRLPGDFESVWDLLVRGNHVWLLGGWAPQSSYRSADGGRSWSRLALPEGLEPFRAITPNCDPLDRLGVVYLLGAVRSGPLRIPHLLRGDDAGKTWREIALPENLSWEFSRSAASFATADKGWIGLVPRGLKSVSHGVWRKDPHTNPAVLYTEDGGITWEHRALPGNEWYITSLCLLESGHGFAAVWNAFLKDPGGPRNGAALYETFDAGRTWAVTLQGKKHFNALFALDERHVWAAGDVPGFAKNDLVLCHS
jgi:photosystem II stability/assembly factor-like uncharacterized protein